MRSSCCRCWQAIRHSPSPAPTLAVGTCGTVYRSFVRRTLPQHPQPVQRVAQILWPCGAQNLRASRATESALVARPHETLQNKWRKCMGIEPTGDAVNAPPNGFEDRGHHQVYKHFRPYALFASSHDLPCGTGAAVHTSFCVSARPARRSSTCLRVPQRLARTQRLKTPSHATRRPSDDEALQPPL